jgi:hypothetical protein
MSSRRCCVRPWCLSLRSSNLPALGSTVVTRFPATTAGSATCRAISVASRGKGACASDTALRQNPTGFPSSVAPLCSLASAYDPGVWLLRGFVSLTAPVPVACWVAQPIGSPKRLSRLTAFTCRFRLGCFAVYASTHLSPPELQDLLPGGADFSFQGRTFTRQWCAALLGARAIALCLLRSED